MSKPDIIREMQQSDQVVHTIGSRQADDLVKAKLVRKVNQQPEAGKGRQHVSLTALGKAYTGGHITEPEPTTAFDVVDEAE